jgi:hypothetical protein
VDFDEFKATMEAFGTSNAPAKTCEPCAAGTKGTTTTFYDRFLPNNVFTRRNDEGLLEYATITEDGRVVAVDLDDYDLS